MSLFIYVWWYGYDTNRAKVKTIFKHILLVTYNSFFSWQKLKQQLKEQQREYLDPKPKTATQINSVLFGDRYATLPE
jgi:hypothetical protein